MSQWNTRGNQPSTITNVPHDFRTGFVLDETIHRGAIRYSLGYRNALTGFVPASIELHQMLAGNWDGNFKIGYNQEDFQTSYLRIGGVQDQIDLNLIYKMTVRDHLSGEIQGLRYFSQNRHYLANGYNLRGVYDHQLWLTYPDYTLKVFGNIYHFNRNGSYGGDITTLFPALTPSQQSNPGLVSTYQFANYQQIIPNSYREGGLVFVFGDKIIEYTHALRPFFWGSLYYNTLTKLSYNVKGGLNTSVFGRDSLLIYAQRGVAPTIINATTYTISAQYSMYY